MTEMRNVDHTHPHTHEPFGERLFGGPAVAADGGTADEADEAERKMRDVDHESPDGEGADRVFERGTEGRDESV